MAPVPKRMLVNDPDLMMEWDHLGNSEDPHMIGTGSAKAARWICKVCDYLWTAKIYSRSQGSGCPACAGKVVVVGVNDLVTVNSTLAQEWDYSNNGHLNPTQVTKSSNLKVGWSCRVCGHKWVSTVNNRDAGNGCPLCAGVVVVQGVNDLQTLNPPLVKEWATVRNLPLTPDQVSRGSERKVWWVCSACLFHWKAAITSRSRGSGCPECNKRLSRIEIELSQLLKAVNNANTSLKWSNGRPLKVDCLLPNKVIVEYDGSHWHKNKMELDIRKTQILTSAGYFVIRVRENNLPFLPSMVGLSQIQHKFNIDPVLSTAEKITTIVQRRLNDPHNEI